ncbi:unnamed protein product, partial [Laminaria digitata]
MALGPDNNFYFSVGNQLHRFDEITGDFIDVFVDGKSEGGLNSPQGLVFGPDGNLYVSSSTASEVIRYDGITGKFINIFMKWTPTGGYGPNRITFGPDGHLYTSDLYGDNILRFDGATGAFIDTFVVANGRLRRPEGLAFGPDGHLYINSGLGAVRRYDGGTGDFIDDFVIFGGPFVFGSKGNVFVGHRSKVRRYNATTRRYIDDFIVQNSGKRLAFGPDNNLYILEEGNRDILRFNGVSGAFIDTYISSSGEVGDFVFGHDGDIYLTS